MRLTLFAVFWMCAATTLTHGETLRAWIGGAPKADMVFVPRDGDLPSAQDNGSAAKHLAQHFYGYLDLSGLPASVFPIKLRLLYDPVVANDSIINQSGIPSRLDDDATVGPGAVREERSLDNPQAAHAIPVWTSFSPVDARLRL